MSFHILVYYHNGPHEVAGPKPKRRWKNMLGHPYNTQIENPILILFHMYIYICIYLQLVTDEA